MSELINPNIKPGSTVRVHQILKEMNAKGEMKERIQIFEGTILGRKWGNSKGATFTIRKVSEGIGVERIFPVHSPWIAKVEVVAEHKVRKAKLYHIKGSNKKLKEKVAAKSK